ncbi:MAG: hypothetical protein E7632_00345 [Ruminococcaceae bacterium]|nr:hypothetical protein [Oscillospiraceae bacterium]
MKKFAAIFLTLALIFSLTACFAELPTVDYNCSAAPFTEKNDKHELRVYYPIITGHENSDALNETLKAAALAYMENYLTYTASDGYYTYEIGTVSATLQHPDVVSFLCHGSYFEENAPHPTAVVYTLNLDLRDGTLMEFADLVSDFPALADRFEKGKFSYISGFDELMSHTTYADMIGQYDETYGIYPPAYLLADGNDIMLAFSIELAFTLGGHAEFAIDIDDIKKSLGGKITELFYQ